MDLKKASEVRRLLAAAMTVVLLLCIPVLATETVETDGPAVRDLKVKTYRDIPYRGGFLVDGQDGGLTYKIVKEPKKGSVTIEGTEFIYTPVEGRLGKDSFTYTATDSAGNTSGEAKVTVVIVKPKSGVKYSDMEGAASAAAAQWMAEEGIFTGSCIGDGYYFEPDRVVTRSEFLAMTLETAGIAPTSVTMTGFCDDEAIPVWAKAYAASGLSEGVVLGTVTEEGVAFRGDEPVTFNQAAAILDRVLSVADVDLAEWYADRDAVPTWAAQAVANMESVSVMAVGSFGSESLNESVTRADAARMLSSAAALLEGEESGPMSWLSDK